MAGKWHWCHVCGRRYYGDVEVIASCPVCGTVGKIVEEAPQHTLRVRKPGDAEVEPDTPAATRRRPRRS